MPSSVQQLSLALSGSPESGAIEHCSLGPGAALLRGFALAQDAQLLSELAPLLTRAPFRQMRTPGGLRMSVAMSNCGALGWVSDHAGYRYQALDPETGAAWPRIPDSWLQLAGAAAEHAGFVNFVPDGCLINRYAPGTRLSLHQDRNERSFSAPIVSVSLGLPAVFLFGGLERNVRARRIPVTHGDVVVWGGPSRLTYHGVLPISPGVHALTGAFRLNLTFRCAA